MLIPSTRDTLVEPWGVLYHHIYNLGKDLCPKVGRRLQSICCPSLLPWSGETVWYPARPRERSRLELIPGMPSTGGREDLSPPSWVFPCNPLQVNSQWHFNQGQEIRLDTGMWQSVSFKCYKNHWHGFGLGEISPPPKTSLAKLEAGVGQWSFPGAAADSALVLQLLSPRGWMQAAWWCCLAECQRTGSLVQVSPTRSPLRKSACCLYHSSWKWENSIFPVWKS